jgi:drug/metabolite transporter (DMT)-like permease
LTYLKLMLTAVFWGGTFIAGRVVAGNVAPFAAAFLRFAIASVLLLAIGLTVEKPLRPPRGWILAAVLASGVSGVASYNFFFFKGLQLLEAGRAAVIIANNPIFIALAAAVFLKERLRAVNAAGVFISVLGAVTAICRGNPATLLTGGLGWGEAFIFACVLSWVTYSLLGKLIMRALSPLVATTWTSVAGSLILLPAALNEGIAGQIPGYGLLDWFCLAYLGICGTVLGFIWYYEGIHRIGPTRAGLFINFVPISAILMAFFILDEPLSLSLGVGTALVTIGVVLANRRAVSPPGGAAANSIRA